MTRKRHPSARTTPKIRRKIRQSAESNNALARRLALNPKIHELADFTFEDISLLDYNPHPPIKAPIAV